MPREATIVAGLAVLMSWLSTGGGEMLRERDGLPPIVAFLLLTYSLRRRETPTTSYAHQFYGPGYAEGTYTHSVWAMVSRDALRGIGEPASIALALAAVALARRYIR